MIILTKIVTKNLCIFFNIKVKFYIYFIWKIYNKFNTPYFFTINIGMEFNIPRWHKSITLPNGNIMLTGGVSCDPIP